MDIMVKGSAGEDWGVWSQTPPESALSYHPQ